MLPIYCSYFCSSEYWKMIKKYLVLGILFLLPITAYVFFASGVNNFAKLPILTNEVKELSNFKTLNGEHLQLANHITVLGFFGNEVASKHANSYNLTHKVYKKNHAFEDFQFVILLEEGMQQEALNLKDQLDKISDTKNWHFAFGTIEAINEIFDSLQTDLTLDANSSTPFVFIIDKERNLRGRDDDSDKGMVFGFNARDIAEINNKMSDDIKVILAEYRLELKKYNSDRKN